MKENKSINHYLIEKIQNYQTTKIRIDYQEIILDTQATSYKTSELMILTEYWPMKIKLGTIAEKKEFSIASYYSLVLA